MSSRALKRLQREREEQRLASASSEQPADSSDENDSAPYQQSKPKNAEDSDGEDGHSEPDLEVDRSVMSSNEQTEETLANQKDVPVSARKKKKGKRRAQNRAHRTDSPAHSEVEDLDEILKNYKLENRKGAPEPSPDTVAHNSKKQGAKSRGLFEVDVRYLDPEAEMQRLFGSKVVGGRERTKRVNGRLPNKKVGRRSTLIPEKEGWPPALRTGLSMDLVDNEDGLNTFRYVHSKTYQGIERDFFACVQSYDPESMVRLLQLHPFHVETCVQVSEILFHQGDHENAGQMIDRALYCLDKGFHPLFNVAAGNCLLPFKYPENRPFYLAIWNHIQNLHRRGCFRTAFEFCKILMSCDVSDPYAAILMIDFFAMRSKRDDFLIDLMEKLPESKEMPNVLYSGGLALWKKTKDTSVLEDACSRFPWVRTQLLAGLDSPVEPYEPPDRCESLYSELYCHRSKDIWAVPEHLALLQQIDCNPAPSKNEPTEDLPENTIRHILVCENTALRQWLPKRVTEQEMLSFDPLPPNDTEPSLYYNEILRYTTTRDDAILDDNLDEQSRQGLLDAMRNFVQRGGGESNGDQTDEILNAEDSNASGAASETQGWLSYLQQLVRGNPRAMEAGASDADSSDQESGNNP